MLLATDTKPVWVHALNVLMQLIQWTCTYRLASGYCSIRILTYLLHIQGLFIIPRTGLTVELLDLQH